MENKWFTVSSLKIENVLNEIQNWSEKIYWINLEDF